MDTRTKSVHTGVNIDKTFNSVITPLYPTSTFYFDAIGNLEFPVILLFNLAIQPNIGIHKTNVIYSDHRFPHGSAV